MSAKKDTPSTTDKNTNSPHATAAQEGVTTPVPEQVQKNVERVKAAVAKNRAHQNSKIILIGDGAVGSSYAYALTIEGIGRELGIIDLNKKKAIGDVMDLSDALSYTSPKKIFAADYEDCADAGLIVICGGAPQKPGETRLQLVDKNLRIFHDIISSVMATGFDGMILVASNPVDILTYAAWRFSGLPSSRVFGSGTALDSARLRKEIGELFNVDARSVHAYIMGEHGDSEFPVWSNANIGGMALSGWIMRDPSVNSKALVDIFDKVVNAAYKIIDAKGATFYGIGVALAQITKAIVRDENSVHAISAYLDGEFGVHDIYTGTPAVIGAEGVSTVIPIQLDMVETEHLESSVKVLRDIIDESFAKFEKDMGIKVPAGVIG
ncbi:L-lactate dehydrogenase [Arcanobacterium wilhelmae]|uniref:L-lactate dehydrogenase n=1 Tax=Arcanobacterium wilhelmae TaxID=1803177 RepID=A0ABT9NCW7_9ACTO|nr:L-lactate dehydrogenase [Arcanobacterium wilhelmae]MDP9801538.1 L-lactate dehydrogenase [Arcanobacterium wilhelmae]WFN90865.1 L-lactate dehydrogenase [Arcanobacterium wilhelmae]